MSADKPIDRREMFSAFLNPLKALSKYRTEPETALSSDLNEETSTEGASVAIIQGRFCLAYQKSFCSTCEERCPEEGAIVVENGIPRVVADKCTGCGICHDLCPATNNAILITRKRA